MQYIRFIVLTMALLIAGVSLSALEADISVGFNARNTDATGFFPQIDIKAEHKYLGLDFYLEMFATTDGLYPPPEDQMRPFYVLVPQGGIKFDSGAIHLNAGRFRQADLSDSPYSLFFSSKKNPALGIDLQYDDGVFFYETRWVQLNYNSALYKQDYPVIDSSTGNQVSNNVIRAPFDRGINYRTIGFHIGDFRLSYMESVVYTGRSFDLEYFLVPVPGYFTQYIRSATGAPWQESKPWGEIANDNFIVGIMLDYTKERWYGVFQILIDDINLNRIIKPSGPQNPDKIALQTGARYKSDIGTFGLFSAMATKYTFQPMGGSNGPSAATNTRYGYTYYPNIEAGGHAIPFADNNIGYINGENNLAFILQYQQSFTGVKVEAGLDFTLTGSQSPVNPWGSYIDWYDGGQGAHWLDDAVLEKRLRLTAGVAFEVDPFTFVVGIMAGVVWNELQIASPVNSMPGNDLKLYMPSDTTRFIGSFTFSAIWHLREAKVEKTTEKSTEQ